MHRAPLDNIKRILGSSPEVVDKSRRIHQELVERIYTDVPPELHPAAARSVLAHLLKLEREGRAVRVGPRSAERFAAAVPRACLRCGRLAPAGSTLCDRCRLSLLQETPGSPA